MRGDYLRRVLATGICPHCETKSDTIDEQYSFGVYAGVMCEPCARRSFRDQCGHGPDGQGDPRDLDEPYEQEEV
jgi:hypothetical protein